MREAISEAFAELDPDQPKREAELERIGADRRRTSESPERYLPAFEEGTMPESACAPRIGGLSEKLRGLEARQGEARALTDEDLALLQAEVREVIETRRRVWRCCIAGQRGPGRQPRGDLPVSLCLRFVFDRWIAALYLRVGRAPWARLK